MIVLHLGNNLKGNEGVMCCDCVLGEGLHSLGDVPNFGLGISNLNLQLSVWDSKLFSKIH